MDPEVSIQAVSGRKRRQASARQVLDGTRRLLARGEPVARLSVDRILKESGVSRATFYACFADKHEVVGRLAQEALAWRQSIEAEDVVHTASIEVLDVVPRFRGDAPSTDRADVRCGGRLTDPDGRVVLALEALQVVRYRSPQTR